MVKNLADELSDILDWVEDPGLGEHAHEEARMGLVIFCRGLVCGLRGGLQVTGDTPISIDEALADALKPDWDKADAKRREELHRKLLRKYQARIHPADEVNRPRPVDEAENAGRHFEPDCH